MNIPAAVKRRPVLVIASVVVLTAFVYVAWYPIRVLVMPSWRRNIEFQFPTLAVVPIPNSPDGIACAPHERIRLLLRNDIIRRSRWTMKEAKYLDALIRAGYPTERFSSYEAYEGMLEDEYKASNQQAAVFMLAARIGLAAPIDDDARKVLEKTLHDEMTNSFEQRRSDAAYNSIHFRAVANPEVRTWVVAAIPTLSEEHQLLVSGFLRRIDEGTEAVKKYKALKEGRSDATKP